jgi:hypothetical protein
MASIPLPALDVRPPAAEPSLLGQYAQLQALKNQQVMQPLQQQEAQNQVQSSAIDLQMKKQQMKDQQAMSATMQQWGQAKPQPSVTTQTGAFGNADTGEPISAGTPLTVKGPAGAGSGATASTAPNYDDLVPLAIKNGASFAAVQQLQAHVLDMKTKAATIAMDDARAGASNADAMKTKNGLITDAMTGVINTPDAQLPQAIQQTAQQLAQQGLFDPPHVQQAMQLAAMAQQNPAQARQALQVQANSLGAFSKLLDDAQKQVATSNEQGKTNPNSPLYAPTEAAVAMGTAPGAQQIQQGKTAQAAATAGAEANARFPLEMKLAQYHEANENARATLGRTQSAQNTVMSHGLSQIDQYTADPQHGYAQFASQAGAVKQAVQSAKDGNQLAASLEPMMLALGVSSFAGVHRINTVEIDRAGPAVGSIFRKTNNLLQQIGTGKPSDAQLNEATDIVNQLTTARHQAYINSVSAVAQNTNIDPSKLTVFDKDGNLAPLTQVQQQMKANTPQQRTGPPPGATHIVPGSDGHNHYTDGKNDLGIAP